MQTTSLVVTFFELQSQFFQKQRASLLQQGLKWQLVTCTAERNNRKSGVFLSS